MERRPCVDIIAGARPNFMKIAPIVHECDRRRLAGGFLRYRLVHTGQHYDPRMSGDFFDQLRIPKPDVNLEVGSGSPAQQTAAIMTRYETLLASESTALCLVVGDVTSTMACAITAQKQGVPVAHVEAGLRSGDWRMPEEINRLVTDSISNYFFTTSRHADANLLQAGVGAERIFFVGNTMIDTLMANMARLTAPAFWTERGLSAGTYFVLTLHRPANVDVPETLAALVHAIGKATYDSTVVFPVHPRTARALAALPALPANLLVVDPQPYLEFHYLVKHAQAVITDSGGITEETTVLGVPCMTLRDTTERPETIAEGTNELLGTSPAAIAPAVDRLRSGRWKSGRVPERWDGRAGARIVDVLEKVLG